MSSNLETNNSINQQVAISQTNGQFVEKKGSQKSEAVAETNFNNSLTSISMSIDKMKDFSNQFRPKIEQLSNIISLIPKKPDENSSDKAQLEKTYLDFKTSIISIEGSYSDISEQYYTFQLYFNQIKTTLNAIYKSIYDKIRTNQILSEKFLETQQEKIEKIETQIETLLKKQENFKNELKKKGFSSQASLFKGAINIGTQILTQSKEVEDYKDQVLKREKELNIEKSKKVLVEIEMKLQKQQEDRLQADLLATQKQKEELIAQYKEQQNDVNNLGKNKKKMVEMLNEQIKQNQKDKEEAAKQICKEHLERSKEIRKIFDNAFKECNDLQITQTSRGFIVVLDESGSMSGQPFQNCVYAIKEQVKYLKSKYPEDEFCMIQFDSKARISVNKSAVQFVREADIGRTFNGGGTDFYQAFRMVKEVVPLFECKVINIMFVTDGGDSNTSAYLKVLKDLKAEYSSNKFQLFGLAFGNSVSSKNIQDCLQEVNGSSMHINANSKKIQSYFEVNVAEDLVKTFKIMFECQSASVEEFNVKQEKRQKLIEQQQEEEQKLKKILLQQYDDQHGALLKQLDQLASDSVDFQAKGTNALMDLLESQKSRLDSKITSQEQLIEEKQQKKLVFLKQLEDISVILTNLEQEMKNYCSSVSSSVQKQAIEKESQVLEKELIKLGFQGQRHYVELVGKLMNIDQIEKSLIHFSLEMTNSISHLNQIKDQVSEGIEQIKDGFKTKEADIQFELSLLVEESMQQRLGKNYQADGLSPKEQIRNMIMITSKEEYDRAIQSTELDNSLDNLCSALELSELLKLQGSKKQPGNANLTVDEYANKVFMDMFHLGKQAKIPLMSRVQNNITSCQEKIEQETKKAEPNESKLELWNDQMANYENQLMELQESLDIIKKENEEELAQFIPNNRKQYDFTRNVIRGIRQVIQLIEYKSRQCKIFQPLQSHASAVAELQEQCDQINQLSIE